MPSRIFLGYDSPFLPNLSSRLLRDREELAEMLLIVPTGQSGRLLRESLAMGAGALLSPNVTTPGALLHISDPKVAPPWLEKIVWIETLESIPAADWENYSGLFPVPPATGGESSEWAVSLASEIVSLRTTLQDRLHNLFSASKFLASTPESARWEDLAKLETLAERRLAAWGFTSRSAKLRDDFQLPGQYKRIVLAGITVMPACLLEALENFTGDITALIAAPESEAENFSPLGLPLDSWATRELPSHANVSITADPQAQAMAALQAVAATGAASPDIALGSADEHAGAVLARVLTENGWPAFHPASSQPPPSLIRWLGAWKNWLSKPSSRHLAALLSLPESSALISGDRAGKLIALNKLRNWHPSIEPQEILPRIEGSDDKDRLALHAAVASLLERRDHFLQSTFPEAITAHLRELGTDDATALALASRIDDFLAAASPIMAKANRNHLFWLRILLSELPAPSAQPPEDRVIDVQGWLELLFEPGAHLVICGMNETFVPSRSGGDPWLSENTRRILGLSCDSDRHSRDAYLLHAMLMMRKATGSAHLFCGKNGAGGEPYLPSRLLLQVPRSELAGTVQKLFREIEPPEANLIWSRDLVWQPPHIELPQHFGVTSLHDYLACPFRFYLKHLVRMSETDPDRREMDARDFGNITHLVVENWGNDPEANQLTDPAKLTACLESVLDSLIFREFGKHPPLAIRIQTHAIRQRLEWFAARQAEAAADGWEIIAVERKFEIPSSDLIIRGKIDRIDRHRETGQIRVIDYKTGDVKKGVEGEHRRKITAATKFPIHIPEDAPPFHTSSDAKGTAAGFIWQNLQLPLYALALSRDKQASPEIPIPCYIHLGKTEDHVKFTTWDSFSDGDLASAQSCADWISSEITQRKFWPPAEKVPYDDFAILSQGRPLAEAFIPEGRDFYP
jgi:ATP-dependent helicase/nuclease subunit B